MANVDFPRQPTCFINIIVDINSLASSAFNPSYPFVIHGLLFVNKPTPDAEAPPNSSCMLKAIGWALFCSCAHFASIGLLGFMLTRQPDLGA